MAISSQTAVNAGSSMMPYLIFGTMITLLSVLVIVPFMVHWWVKKKNQGVIDNGYGGPKLSKIGLITCTLYALVIIFGAMSEYLLPDSRLGDFTSTRAGKIYWVFGMLLVGGLIDRFLGGKLFAESK